MTPDLGIENVQKAIVRNLDMVLNTEGREGALEFLEQVKDLCVKYRGKVLLGEPVRRRQKTRQG